MVEFGILALLFTLIMFAIADFGMLLNGWIAVSSATREAGRRASMGENVQQVTDAARNFAPVPGVRPQDVKVVIDYCAATDPLCQTPSVTQCDVAPSDGTTCLWQPAFPTTTPPSPGDTIRVRVIADTFEVITPLVRPFFCNSSQPHCNVPLRSHISMRYEGPPPGP